MSVSPNIDTLVKASFKRRDGGEKFMVHFNPQSLQYTITNNLRNTGSGNSRKQYVSDSTGKLTMDLIFDTTDTGEDVRLHTVKVAKLMEPRATGSDRSKKTPPVVDFSWGLYTFGGMVESYKETLDFFSSNGVPLRAAVNLTMASQDKVFEGGSTKGRARGIGGSLSGSLRDSIQVQIDEDSPRGVDDIASVAGNPAAAREIAAQNGIDNLRFPGPVLLELDADQPPDFAPSMLAASRDPSDVFAGLRTPSAGGGGAISLDHFMRPTGTASLGTESPAVFALGGQARLQGSASFKAEVGRAGALKARLEFDGEQ
ncbi:hypothetical protein ACHHRT_01185 [Desulfurivibrio sp. D14AmB]|uniref:CIS tube protein n=1 Tax=Desulfurivibrio sp. D14AmB TaxID=3374370 RepID=UPI00376F1045